MTREELFALADSTLDEATGAGAVVRLKDEIANLLTINDSLTATNETLKAANNTLRDTNAQLAIRVTQPVEKTEDKKEEPETPEDAFEALVNQIKES